jgi:hypothetical protein
MSGSFLRTFLTATAIAAFAAGPAAATDITVDGSISDWQALGLVHTDNIAAPLGYLQITAYGATVQNGTFYAFVQTSPGVSGFLYAWTGAWINADQNAGTQLGGLPLSSLAGTDLVVERDMDIFTPGLNYWGASGNVNNLLSAVSGGQYAQTGNVFEWSAPVSGIIAALAATGKGVTSGSTWSVYLAGEGTPDDSTGFGMDVAGPLTVAVPEPGTLVLLVTGAGCLLVLMHRRRRRA